MRKRTVFRSAKTGFYVTEKYAKRHPKTCYRSREGYKLPKRRRR
jgi:hypothetical protein